MEGLRAAPDPVELPAGMFINSGQLQEVIQLSGRYLAENIKPPGPDPNPTRDSIYGEPQGFGGHFPFRVISLAGGTGQHKQKPWFPEYIEFDARVYGVAVSGAGRQSGAAKANDSVLLSYGEWVEALFADTQFRSRLSGLGLEEFSIGIADRFGRYLRDERRNVLWRLQSRLRLKL